MKPSLCKQRPLYSVVGLMKLVLRNVEEHHMVTFDKNARNIYIYALFYIFIKQGMACFISKCVIVKTINVPSSFLEVLVSLKTRCVLLAQHV